MVSIVVERGHPRGTSPISPKTLNARLVIHPLPPADFPSIILQPFYDFSPTRELIFLVFALTAGRKQTLGARTLGSADWSRLP